MAVTDEQLKAVMTGSEEQRVKELRRLLDYPLQLKDPQGSKFWYLRPGVDESEAEDTRPIAVEFLSLLNQADDAEITRSLTAEDPSHIQKHYLNQIGANQPALYILLPEAPRTGRIAFVLPGETQELRQRNIQTWDWQATELLNRFRRISNAELPIAAKALLSIPLVERVFYEPAKTAEQLAKALAIVARQMERAIPEAYDQENDQGYLHKLLLSFQRELIPNLKLSSDNEKDYSFADIYAQTIAYGLFTARVFSHVQDQKEGKQTDFNRENAWALLPETNPFLRQLFRDVSDRNPAELGETLTDAIAEIFGILRAAEMKTILDDFRAKMNREDIVIRFYEDFLAAYKPQMRERRGVYYTPEPVVSYMVRSVDVLLKEKFNKPLGLADPEVMILDPACGTGTFLLWIFQLIHQRFKENPEALTDGLADQSWSGYVKDRLLPRIFGFELLMAPYAIAHLKLGLFLEETGYLFDSAQRLGIYLTNTLDEAIKRSETLFDEFIAKESTDAAIVKRDLKIKVVIGNPPYSISSVNKSEYIESLMEEYKKDVRHERNIQALSDDYIKFIRFAHEKIRQTSHGIISFITNHSYISGLSHRGMRKKIANDFEQIFLFDLHGNISMKEVCPDGSVDENVFDIRQGTSICFWIKIPIEFHEKRCIKHSSLWGLREHKYKFLVKRNITNTDFYDVNFSPPYFFFDPRDTGFEEEYQNGYELQKIFPVNSNGLETGKDETLISFEKERIEKYIKEIANTNKTDIEIQHIYGIKDTSGWPFFAKRTSLIQEGFNDELIVPIAFRPFDQRYTYFHKILRRRQEEVLKHLMKDNIGILAMRQVVSGDGCYNHFGIVENIADNRIFTSNRGRPSVFPLYIYDKSKLLDFKHENISKEFRHYLRDKLGLQVSPEKILYYIYAIFHSPTYRNRYAEFLKIDFPRVPLTSNPDLFQQLAIYGEELVALHLMKSAKLDTALTQFEGNAEPVVDPGHPKYANGKVSINKKGDAFTGVPEAVWNFYVGGYQVCHKWLKDRKGRTLSPEDINHYQRIVVALQETIDLMQKIDEAIPGWPLE